MLLALLCLLASAPAAAFGPTLEDVKYMTEQYYPFNYNDGGVLKGLSVEVLNQTWAELGMPRQPIEVLPWARAFQRLEHEPLTMLFSTCRTPVRDRKFLWAGPIMTVKFVLIAKKKRHIVLETLNDLAGRTVGTLRKDIAETLLADYAAIARIESVSDMRQNVLKLQNDRVDMVAYEERAWRKIAARSGLSPNDFETVYVLRKTPIYFAFHGNTPHDLVRDFQSALERVKRSPVYQQILQNYLD